MAADPVPAGTDPLEFALRYAGLGLRVVPIKPGAKRPELPAWQDAATVDRTTIEAWWSGLYRGHGVGLALGAIEDYSNTPTYIFAVDVDQHGIDGGAMLADLEAENEPLPDTVEATTGGGGRHLLFTSPVEVRNGKLCDGVDIRGAGGQIVVEPTVHPSGQRYSWDDTAAPWDRDITPAPAWLLDALTRPVPAPVAPAAKADTGTRPGDRWAAETPWQQILEADGWILHHVDASGEMHWTRPGKERRDGTSATTGYTANDNLKVFTSSVPQLDVDEVYTKLGYLAAMHHHGDHTAAARWLAEKGYGTAPDDPSDLAVAVAPIAADTTDTDEAGGWPIASADFMRSVLSGEYRPPALEVLLRSDGAGLLYRGRVHSLAGEPGGGKTWVALAAAREQINLGNRVVFLDYEDRPDTAVRRLVALGVDVDAMLEHFAYVTPTYAIRSGALPANVLDLADGAALAIVDSMGEALSHSELDQNVDTEVRAWMATAARRLADGGAAVLLLDHVVKDADSRGRWAIGSQRKLAAIDGVAYMMTTTAPANRDTVGRAAIRCSKDRLGNYAHHSTVAEVTMTPHGDDLAISLDPPATDAESGEMLLTGYMEKVSRYLEDMGEPMSGRAITTGVSGATDYIRTALRQLVERGFVTTESGPRSSVIHRLERPFRELDDLTAPPRLDRASTAPRRGAKTTGSDRATAPGSLDQARSRSGHGALEDHSETDDRASAQTDPSDDVEPNFL